MGIEDLPIITNLEGFVQKLPIEFRAEVYHIAESFYHVGAGDGIMEGMMGALVGLGGSGESTKPKENRSEEYRRYFARKAREAALEANNAEKR